MDQRCGLYRLSGGFSNVSYEAGRDRGAFVIMLDDSTPSYYELLALLSSGVDNMGSE